MPMHNPKTDTELWKDLNAKYKDRVNELCSWDLNVIDWKIIITKWWGSNNQIIFSNESELSMFLDGVEWQVHISQWHQQQKDLKYIIDKCKYYIREIKASPEYFSDGFDIELIDDFKYIKKLLSKYVD